MCEYFGYHAVPCVFQAFVKYKCVKGCSSGACESGAVEAEVQIQSFDIAGLVWESFVLEEGLDLVRGEGENEVKA